MNEKDWWSDLLDKLPVKVTCEIHYVFERVHWNCIEVCFHKPGELSRHVVRIPKEDWLNDVAVARICLECP